MPPVTVACLRSPQLGWGWGPGEQVDRLLAEWFSPVQVFEFRQAVEDDMSGLFLADGTNRFQVLVVPGGDDRAFMGSLARPAAFCEHIRRFVAQGGGYVGICAGMSIATRGYWDIEGWTHDTVEERRMHDLPHFLGLLPAEVENLHGVRRVNLGFGLDVPPEHAMRQLPGACQAGRYNDGNSVPPGLPGVEYVLQYQQDEPWDAAESNAKGSLVGKWATIAYIDPEAAGNGRLVLHGWHPESKHTPQCHEWLRWAVAYAAERAAELYHNAGSLSPRTVDAISGSGEL